ncbi:MAG TPA: rhomboid family intramembrane serine protease [Azospirillaceae bacterium]|nr:rhomboid family intramembrane serine protease [Azospirillaceae bacterium]HRQ80792.1 rhomboid family intramembrane serine protease [Azospirillaceae bacterium]
MLACLAPAALGLPLDWLAFLPVYLFGLGDGPINLWAGLRGLFGYFLVHDGPTHLFANVLGLALFGGALESRVGATQLFTLFIAASVAAALVEGAFITDHALALAGASGGVSGLMGALAGLTPGARLGLRLWPSRLRAGLPLVVLTALDVGANLLTGAISLTAYAPFTESVAWRAHLTGFVFGLAAGVLLRRAHDLRPVSDEVRLTVGFAAAQGWRMNGLTLLVWLAALAALAQSGSL